MISINLKIIQELKYFINTVSSDPELRKLVTYKNSDFSRERKLPFKNIIGILISMPKRSLSIEIQEFFNTLAGAVTYCTKGAFSLQRSKLQAQFFYGWNQWLVDSFYKFYGKAVKRWCGFRLLAVDGTTSYLFDKGDIREYFGTKTNQRVSVPMARIVQVYDVLNEMVVMGRILPIKEGERSIICGWTSYLYDDSLTLFDRGFPSFALMYLMENEETPRHFVMRCRTDFNNTVKGFAEGNQTDSIVYMKATYKSIKELRKYGYIITPENKIKVRMVKFKLPSGQTEILLTNLFDQAVYTINKLKQLYNLRWKVETCYGKQKNQLQMEQFSGHRAICILQDYAVNLFVSNLQNLLEKGSADHLKKMNHGHKYSYKINRNTGLAFLKDRIVKLFLSEDAEEILKWLQTQFERNLCPVRPNRKYSRNKHQRHLNGKYHTETNYRRAI